MGYRIGNVCHATREEAENVYFSQVLPAVGADGQLHQPVYTASGWMYHGKAIQAYLPTCDPVESFTDGLLIGWSLFAIAAAVWGIKFLGRFLG